uniref:F-box/LRR-repeat protein n=2 Tax=Noccaea caerulescens TaxID=107243 RepID=A0A1J3K638_NOCCA
MLCSEPLGESRFEGSEELVYLHYNTERPSMTCEGLVCFPDPDWIHVLNPSTGQIRRFPTDLDPDKNDLTFFIRNRSKKLNLSSWTYDMNDWSMGFGRDNVTGSFKIVKMCCYSRLRLGRECAVLDVETGDWRKVALPCYVHRLGNHSACVNGSIYWLYKEGWDDKLLAFDLHKEEFHDVSVPAMFLTWKTQVVNLEDRVALARSEQVGVGGSDWILEILTMEEGTWSKTYSISLPRGSSSQLFRPVALSKQGGDLVLYDNSDVLYKYCPGTDEIRCLSSHTRVLSPYLENLVPLAVKSSHPPLPVPFDPEFCPPRRQPCPLSEPVSWKSYFFFQLKEEFATCIPRSTLLLLVLSSFCFLHFFFNSASVVFF